MSSSTNMAGVANLSDYGSYTGLSADLVVPECYFEYDTFKEDINHIDCLQGRLNRTTLCFEQNAPDSLGQLSTGLLNLEQLETLHKRMYEVYNETSFHPSERDCNVMWRAQSNKMKNMKMLIIVISIVSCIVLVNVYKEPLGALCIPIGVVALCYLVPRPAHSDDRQVSIRNTRQAFNQILQFAKAEQSIRTEKMSWFVQGLFEFYLSRHKFFKAINKSGTQVLVASLEPMERPIPSRPVTTAVIPIEVASEAPTVALLPKTPS